MNATLVKQTSEAEEDTLGPAHRHEDLTGASMAALPLEVQPEFRRLIASFELFPTPCPANELAALATVEPLVCAGRGWLAVRPHEERDGHALYEPAGVLLETLQARAAKRWEGGER